MLNIKNLRNYKTICLVLVVASNLSIYTRAESVTLIKKPNQISSVWTWSWTATGASGRVEQWKNNRNSPPQYTACETSTSTQPDQWLTSEAITIGPANRIDVTIEYAMSDCSDFKKPFCRHNYSLYIHKSTTKLGSSNFPDPYTKNHGAFEKIGTSSPKVLSTVVITKAENKETFPVITDAAKPYVYLAFHYQGGCVSLFTVSVHYYYCPAISLSSSLVQLPQTTAPANGSVQVKGFCNAQHTKPLTNESDLYGYCKDNGEWSTDGECGCDYGYGKVVLSNGGSECRECPLNTYKNTISNSNCTACPRNSIQDANRTGCYCDTGFYRTEEENEFSNCSGQPSVPQNVTVAFLNASFVSVIWNPPSDDGGRSDVYYTVECNQCNDQRTDCTRECTASNITVDQNSRRASIYSLSAYTYYRFKVYAKNGVSKLAEKNKEKAKHADVTLRTNDSIPGSPVVTVKQLSPTSVSLSWEVREKNGIITFYQVSYYPVNQPSNIKKFNTTFTSATITGLKTGKEYRFEVQASTRLGLGPPAIQTKKVVDKPFFSKPWAQGLIGGIVGALILILIIVIVCLSRKKRRRAGSKEHLTLSPDFIPLEGHKMYIDPSNYGSPMEALLSTADEIDRKNIELEKNIGGGEFADVYKGKLKTSSGSEIVAVKILKPKSTQKNREDFILEASIMGQFKHPNVISLNGVVTRSPDTPMMIITEFMANGSLDHFLKNHDGQLTTLQLLGIARGVAAGMAYLSGMSFIHRDLAARNILVADNMASKVADFGLSRELGDSEDNPDSEYQTQGGKIPVRWTAPEAIRYRKFSSASDVWSFGILMWEIMSFGERPYWDWDNYQVMDRVESGYRLPAPMNCPRAIHNLMLDCWDKDKNNRPKFPDIVQRIEEMIRSPEKIHELNSNHCVNAITHTNFDEMTSVMDWLGSINMARYAENFVDAGYMDLAHIKCLEEEDLARIGIKLIGHRNKINKSIKAMNKHFESLESRPEMQTLI